MACTDAGSAAAVLHDVLGCHCRPVCRNVLCTTFKCVFYALALVVCMSTEHALRCDLLAGDCGAGVEMQLGGLLAGT